MQGIVGRAQLDMRLAKIKSEDCSDEGLSDKGGQGALLVCVRDLTFSCKDATLPSTLSCDRGVLRSSGVKSFLWNSGLHSGDEASGLYA